MESFNILKFLHWFWCEIKVNTLPDEKMESRLCLECSDAACYFRIITEGNQISRSIPFNALLERERGRQSDREMSGFQLDI